MSKYSERGTDVSVSLDLMTHDLDLVMMLMGALPKAVRGETRTEKSAAPDVAKGELTFENGAATLIASRLEDDFSRTMGALHRWGIGMGKRRIIGAVALGTLLFGGAFVALNWTNIKRLQTVNTLFDEDKIVQNFSNMNTAFLHQQLDGSPTPFIFPKAPQPLPENVTINGQEQNLEKLLTDLDTTGLVILKDGVIIHESYGKGTAQTDLRISWSVAKSFMSGLYGNAVASGAIKSLDDKVEDYAPSLKGSAYEGATIRNVLNMASGITFNEDYMDPKSDINDMGGENVAFALGGLNLSTRDYAKFGQMFLQGGEFNGKQVVPSDWVAASTVHSAPTMSDRDVGYGYQWWIPMPQTGSNKGDYTAAGIYGQYIYVNPARGIIIAKNAADREFAYPQDGYGHSMNVNMDMFRSLADYYGR